LDLHTTLTQERTLLNKNYLYNGKELTTELGLEDYNYGPRRYDPAGIHPSNTE